MRCSFLLHGYPVPQAPCWKFPISALNCSSLSVWNHLTYKQVCFQPHLWKKPLLTLHGQTWDPGAPLSFFLQHRAFHRVEGVSKPQPLGLPPVADCHSLALGVRLGVPVKFPLPAIIVREAPYTCTSEGSFPAIPPHPWKRLLPSHIQECERVSLCSFVLSSENSKLGHSCHKKGLSILLPCHQCLAEHPVKACAKGLGG